MPSISQFEGAWVDSIYDARVDRDGKPNRFGKIHTVISTEDDTLRVDGLVDFSKFVARDPETGVPDFDPNKRRYFTFKLLLHYEVKDIRTGVGNDAKNEKITKIHVLDLLDARELVRTFSPLRVADKSAASPTPTGGG